MTIKGLTIGVRIDIDIRANNLTEPQPALNNIDFICGHRTYPRLPFGWTGSNKGYVIPQIHISDHSPFTLQNREKRSISAVQRFFMIAFHDFFYLMIMISAFFMIFHLLIVLVMLLVNSLPWQPLQRSLVIPLLRVSLR